MTVMPATMSFVIKPGVDPIWDCVFVMFPQVDRIVEELVASGGETDYDLTLYFKDDLTVPYSIHEFDEESDLRDLIEEIVMDGFHMGVAGNN